MKFVMLVADGAISPAASRYLASDDVAELPFASSRHTQWSDIDGKVHFAAWEQGRGRAAVIADQDLVAVAGEPRPRRGVWPSHRSVAELVRDATDRSPRSPAGALCDAYAIARLDRDGTGFVAMDPLGLHPLFISAESGVTVMGNRADLVGEVAARANGRSATRDTSSGAWLAFAGYQIGLGTGMEHVEIMPPHTMATIGAGKVSVEQAAPLYQAGPDEPNADPHELAEELAADIADSLRHAIAQSYGRPDLELTGGKDSRLVLAVAISAGLAEDFRIVSYGPEDLPDMQVAAAVAASVGLEHHDISDEHYRPAAEFIVADRCRRHVHRSAGGSGCGYANEPTARSTYVVSSHAGELYRTANNRVAAAPSPSVEEAERLFRGRAFGRAGLVRPDVAAELWNRATEFHLAPKDDVADAAFLRPAYFMRCVLPRWQGPLADIHQKRVLPLYSPGAIRSAFRLSIPDRNLEAVHSDLIGRVPGLRDVPLANDSWRGDSTPPSTSGTERGVPPSARSRPEPTTDSELKRFVGEVIAADPGHVLFDVVDRARALDVAARFDQLVSYERTQVLGLLTGLLWMGRDELPSRTHVDE